MTHPEIETGSLIDRYVQGKLPVTQREAFEEHFVDCRACLEQLEAARGLQGALRASTSVPAVRQVQKGRQPWIGLALAACLALALSPSAVLYQKLQRARGEASAPAVFVLDQSRGGSDAPRVVDVPPGAGWVVLLLQLDLSGFASYRATLKDASGGMLWQASLRPTSPDALAVSLPASALASGSYSVAIEGQAPGQPPRAVASFPFDARRP